MITKFFKCINKSCRVYCFTDEDITYHLKNSRARAREKEELEANLRRFNPQEPEQHLKPKPIPFFYCLCGLYITLASLFLHFLTSRSHTYSHLPTSFQLEYMASKILSELHSVNGIRIANFHLALPD